MKLVRAPQAFGLQDKIKSRFSEFNRLSPVSKGRRYPEELIALLVEGNQAGIKPALLRRLSGVSGSALHSWLKAGHKVAPRRLEVVRPTKTQKVAGITILLASGVAIELSDSGALTNELLSALNTLEVRHAAPC